MLSKWMVLAPFYRSINSSQFLLEPGVQDGIGAVINGFCSQFAGRGSKQGEQFCGFPANILVILARWHSLWLPRRTGIRNGLIRTLWWLLMISAANTGLCEHLTALLALADLPEGE
jgi:hypothetical protein